MKDKKCRRKLKRLDMEYQRWLTHLTTRMADVEQARSGYDAAAMSAIEEEQSTHEALVNLTALLAATRDSLEVLTARVNAVERKPGRGPQLPSVDTLWEAENRAQGILLNDLASRVAVMEAVNRSKKVLGVDMGAGESTGEHLAPPTTRKIEVNHG